MKKLILFTALIAAMFTATAQCPSGVTGWPGLVTQTANYMNLSGAPSVTGQLMIRYELQDASFPTGWNHSFSGGWRVVNSFNAVDMTGAPLSTPMTIRAIFGYWDGTMANSGTTPYVVELPCSTDVFTITLLPYPYCAPVGEYAYLDTLTTGTPVVNFSAIPIPGITNYQLSLQVGTGTPSVTGIVISPGQQGLEFSVPYQPGVAYSWHIDAISGTSVCQGQGHVFQSNQSFSPVTPIQIVNGSFTGSAQGNGNGNGGSISGAKTKKR